MDTVLRHLLGRWLWRSARRLEDRRRQPDDVPSTWEERLPLVVIAGGVLLVLGAIIADRW